MTNSFLTVGSCDGSAYAQLLERIDPRRLCTESAKARVWIGYLEYAIEKHATSLPRTLHVGGLYANNFRLDWDPDAPGVEFHVITRCQHGELSTAIALGHIQRGGGVIGNPPRRRRS